MDHHTHVYYNHRKLRGRREGRSPAPIEYDCFYLLLLVNWLKQRPKWRERERQTEREWMEIERERERESAREREGAHQRQTLIRKRPPRRTTIDP